MFFSSTWLLVSLISLWILPSVKVSAQQCSDSPVFTPPSLVVQYDHPASVTCSVCEKDCTNSVFGLEHAVGSIRINGTTIVWTVDNYTEWDTLLLCYYLSVSGVQCVTRLNITLYQPPDNVSVEFAHGDGPLLAGQVYTVQCTARNVAPANFLKVTFYRGQEPLAQKFSTSEDKKPVDVTLTHSFNTSEEDDGAEYWCDARLYLEGHQFPPAVPSPRLPATVLYKPQLRASLPSGTITIKVGHTLELDCSAVGRPSPSYVWTHQDNARSFSNTSVYSIKSVRFGDEGLYTCTANNSMGAFSVSFKVDVEDNNIGLIIGLVIAALVVIIIVGFLIYNTYYRYKKTGSYYPEGKIYCCNKHNPVATSE